MITKKNPDRAQVTAELGKEQQPSRPNPNSTWAFRAFAGVERRLGGATVARALQAQHLTTVLPTQPVPPFS